MLDDILTLERWVYTRDEMRYNPFIGSPTDNFERRIFINHTFIKIRNKTLIYL